ncbi:hypothetical protein ACWEPC_35735 [Nonomuraea sp. NPDC004297]
MGAARHRTLTDARRVPAAAGVPGTWSPAGGGARGDVTVLEQPGPPPALSWALCTLPVPGLIAFLVAAWRRHRPSRHLALLGL